MASRKEDEKNERIIRGLLKLPENRRCINCNSLGPQYVCTNFWTFVCTNCSGIHREFTHRVKSVSMAKFTSQEVKSLQEGGNQRAKEIYQKELDPQRNSFPDSSNVERLRDFIKHVYVDRRYTGERNIDKPPRLKTGDKEDSYENRRLDSYQGSRSPPYDDDRRSERSSPGGRSYEDQRSPGYDQESRQYGDSKRSPSRPEIVNDWRREDRFGNGRRYDDRRGSDGDSKLYAKSPDRSRDIDSSSPPMVRPVRDILGDKTIPLRIIEPPKANSVRATEGPVVTQRTASSSSLGSTNGNPVEVKPETSVSLIDFDADIEPAPAPAVPQTQQASVAQSYSQPENSQSDNNWASFDVAPQVKATQAPPSANSLESLLSQLSVSAPVPSYSGTSGNTGGFSAAGNMTTPFGGNPVITPAGHTMLPTATTVAPVTSLSTFPPVGAPVATPGLAQVFPTNTSNVSATGSGQWPSMQHQQPSLFPSNGIQSASQQYIPSAGGASSNQPWNSAQGQPSYPAAQAPQDVSRSNHNVSNVASQHSAGDVKSIGRSALPEDLFAMNYSSYPAPVPGWQTGPPHGMGFAMPYNTAMPIPSFQQSLKSANPFDVSSDPPPVQASTFHSMAPSQGPLPNVQPPSDLLRTSSLGALPSAWGPSYSSGLPLQAPPYASQMPPSAYAGQQIPSSLPPPGYQGAGGFSAEGAAFGSLNMVHQPVGRYSAPATPNPFPSAGGNPFG
uniref:probable ADP-ribosylation factor GTPase-activating protein AGD14 isoform X1 n=1 Tax=Fragaria vesca subsp. vesca TaxID=101020 RepID=UPI0005C99C2A|nr:PREDICTED: probable ADP-ribosylation factor GTPase-activating protein AGD14 isoform X1 [Fragaria vesca subsp. vesca]XP_011458085.1 PREDICTED: probable ADP-ribosylation factor GTPase-activating protein AGD14 isoform X1 [Fragaria vesca subsp. vesca]